MSLKTPDRAKERVDGTTTLVLSGAARRSFRTLSEAGIDSGDLFPGTVVHRTNSEWKSGVWRRTGNNIEVVRVDGSSSGGEDFTFSSGAKDVFSGPIGRRSERYIDVADYVSTDDTQDAATGIAAALADGVGREVVFSNPYLGQRIYRVLSRGSAAFTIPDRCRLIFEAPVDFSAIGIDGTQKTFFKALGTVSAVRALASDVTAGTIPMAIPLTSGSVAALGLAAGDFIRISSGARFPAGFATGYQGEFARIKSISSDTVTVYDTLRDSYATADTAVVEKVSFAQVRVENPRILGPGRFTSDFGDIGLALEICRNSQVVGGEFGRCDYQSLRLKDSIDSVVDGATIWHDPPGANTNVQYGIAYVNGCQNLRIKGNTIYGGKHGVVQTLGDVPGVTREVTVSGNRIYGTWQAGIAVHENAELLVLAENHLIGTNHGFDCRVQRLVSRGNHVRMLYDGNEGLGFELSRNIKEFTSTDDIVEGGRYGYRLASADAQLGSGPIDIRISGAILIGQSQRAIELTYDDDSNSKRGLSITDVTTRDCTGASIYVEGAFNEGTIARCMMGRASSGGGAPIQTVGVTNFDVTDNKWDSNYGPALSLAGTTIYARRNGRIGTIGWRPESAVVDTITNVSTTAPTTDEQLLGLFTIPGYAVRTGGVIFIEWQGNATDNAGGATKTWRARIATTGNGLTGDQYGGITQTTNISVHQRVAIAVTASTTQKGHASSAPAFGASSGTSQSSSLDPTGDIEVAITGQCANAADSMSLLWAVVKVINEPKVA